MKTLQWMAFDAVAVAVAVTVALAGWAGLPGTAGAVSLAAPTQVIARVGASCSSAMATDLDFGTFVKTDSNIDATGTLTMTCTNATVYAITAGYGANASGTQRRMKAVSGATMNYEIYTTSARTTSYPATGTTQSYTATGIPQSVTIYGRIPVQTVLGSGAFSDVLTWTLSY